MAPNLSTATVVQTATITNGPALDDDRFQGWFIHTGHSSSLEAIDCPSGSTWSTTKNYAQCCDTGSTTCADFLTTCISGYPVAGNTLTCEDGLLCGTLSIFDQYPINGATFHEQILCSPTDYGISSIFRNVVVMSLTTSLSTISEASPSTPATTSALPAPYNAETSTPFASQTSTSTTQTSQIGSSPTPASTSSSSEAWIAGAVIGPVAAVMMFALLLWFLRSRRKRQHDGSTDTALMYDHNRTRDATTQQHFGTQYDTKTIHGHQSIQSPAELDHNQIHEMRAEPRTLRPHELPE